MSFSPFSVSVSWKIFPLYHRLSEKASAAEREQTDTMKTILLGNFRDRHKHRWIIPPCILRLTVLIIIRQCLMSHWHHLFRQERPSLAAWNPLFCAYTPAYDRSSLDFEFILNKFELLIKNAMFMIENIIVKRFRILYHENTEFDECPEGEL